MQSGRVADNATGRDRAPPARNGGAAAEAGLRQPCYACTKASRSALRTSALIVSIPCE